jgi:hypothetical protein
MDGIADGAPVVDRTLEAEVLAALHSTIEGHPAHQACMRELPRWSAHLPHPPIWKFPNRLQVLKQNIFEASGVVANIAR